MVARLKLKGIDGRAPPGVEPACAVSEEGAEQRGVRSVREFSQVFQDLLWRFFRYFYYIRFQIYYTVSVV